MGFRSNGIKPGEAESLKRQYFATFGKVHEYLESLVSSAREKDIRRRFMVVVGIFRA